jgi:ADP-dependent NAD(P)H-hydrate dehydratase / NAD(P)H-hydrate epimerase
MKIVTAAEMREIDRASTQKFGVPSLTLMENAGSAVAAFVLSRYPDAKRIGVVCGKGNNGGDGFVAARLLHAAGRNVQILLLAGPSEVRGDAAETLDVLPFPPIVASSNEDMQQKPAQTVLAADVVLDAILGTGFRPPVSGLYAEAIHALNASRSTVVAVDIPSGADADVMGQQTGTMARADAIVTFTAPRPAHVFGGLTAGPTIISPIGSPEDAVTSLLHLNLITPKEIAPLIGPRPRASNKGSFGHVLVIGGSLGKAGAAAMASISSLRVGAGLCTVATAQSVLATVAGFHPEVMTEPLPETPEGSISMRALDSVRKLAGKKVLAIGPGISRVAETSGFVRELVKNTKLPTVLDADGLNAFEAKTDELNGRNRTLVITPHPGEMARLLGSTVDAVQRDRITIARTFAQDHDLVLVLKGHRTLIARPDGEVWVNPTGNPGMSTGGAGDILTGMVAGLIAQNPEHAFEAVLAAVFLHGLAGDVAAESTGEHSLIATDLVAAFPEAFRRIREHGSSPTVEIHV